jgi:hypothetical protein
MVIHIGENCWPSSFFCFFLLLVFFCVCLFIFVFGFLSVFFIYFSCFKPGMLSFNPLFMYVLIELRTALIMWYLFCLSFYCLIFKKLCVLIELRTALIMWYLLCLSFYCLIFKIQIDILPSKLSFSWYKIN